MPRYDINDVRAALEVLRESEAMLLHLQISTRSVSSGYDLTGIGLDAYLKVTRKSLRFQLVVGFLRNLALHRLFTTTSAVFRGFWSRITKRPQSKSLMK